MGLRTGEVGRTEYLDGRWLYAIAERLTQDRIANSSAYDRARNPHRCGLAWSKSTIRAISPNSRYPRAAGLEPAGPLDLLRQAGSPAVEQRRARQTSTASSECD